MDAKLFKEQLLFELYKPYINCTRCPLGTLGRTHVVFGEGNANASLLFVGEGPGAQEDEQARPFVGRSGKLLTKTLNELGIAREDVFISNVVKCRPPENRAPTPLESSTCKNLLLFKQIKIIRPQVICTLGSIALQGLFDKDIKISQYRGKPITWHQKESILVLPTFHPAYILRNPAALPEFKKDIAHAIELSQKNTL